MTSAALTAGLLAAWVGGGCAREAVTSAAQTLRFAVEAHTTVSGSLAEEYRHAIPNVTVEAVVLDQPDAIKSLQDGQSDLTVATADAAYFAHSASDRSPRKLRALAAIYHVQLHVVVSPGSQIRGIADLPGRDVYLMTNLPIVPLAASYFGMNPDSALRLPEESPLDAGRQALLGVGTGDIEAVMFGVTAPSLSTIVSAKRGARLIPIEGPLVSKLLRENPFVRPVTIRAHTYPGQSATINTIGVDRLVICRADLSEGLAYELTRKLFEALPRLAAKHQALRQMDPDYAPATSIPLHPGAARYYREWELSR